MDFNTFLLYFGVGADNFVNKENEPIEVDGGLMYEVDQDPGDRRCPRCGAGGCTVCGHYFTETSCGVNENMRAILRIRRVRLRCRGCGATHSPAVSGIERGCTISSQVSTFIMGDFSRPLSFSEIAGRYGLTRQRVIQMFDERVRFVPRRPMPRVLCIDEIRFAEEPGQNYCCVLYDFDRREIVDIVRNRRMAYLDEYFSAIPLRERENTKVFISDMYDAYATVCRRYFPKASHVVDKFHVVAQLSRAVNGLRVKAMESAKADSSESPLYNFMKTNWKLFLCRQESVPDRTYAFKATGEVFHYDELLMESVRSSARLGIGYLALQDLLHMSDYSTHEEALSFVTFLSRKLASSDSGLLRKAGETYWKWRYEIANAYTREAKRERLTNSIAECLNNQLKTIIKSAYGYHNFERFRKRAMLIITYSKKG